MAASGKVKLAAIEVENKNYRVIEWCPPSYFSTTTNTHVSSTPLFLGADVLCGSGCPTKNHVRVHARYAKEGLATKVTFKDTRIEGIHNSESLWFYNIKGLFKATFELHGSDVQAIILTHMRDIWLRNKQNGALPEELTLYTYPNGIASSQGEEELHLKTGQECMIGNKKHIDAGELPALDIQDGGVVEASCEVVCRSTDKSDIDAGECSTTNDALDTPLQGIMNKLGVLVDTMKKYNSYSPNMTSWSNVLDLVLDFLDMEMAAELQQDDTGTSDALHSSDRNLTFLPEILQNYLTVIQSQAFEDYEDEKMDIPTYLNIFMCTISIWLGQQFNGLRDIVEGNVQSFKQTHIGCIDNLPPAKEIVAEIFPTCMSLLLQYWSFTSLGEKKENSLIEVDHTYSPPNKKKCASDSNTKPLVNFNCFPLIQIVLEFLNNSLISGVAHVVFSRVMSPE